MKKCYLLLVILLLCIGQIAQGEGVPAIGDDAVHVALYGTGYEMLLPANWTTVTGTDSRQSLVDAASPDGTRRLLVFCNEQKSWQMDDWKRALHKASENNSVENINEMTLDGRRFITYEMQILDPVLPEASSWAAATELSDGMFATLEFRNVGDGAPEEWDTALRDEILSSLRVVGS